MGSWVQIVEAVADDRVDLGVLPDVPKDGRFEREVCLHQSVVAIVHRDDPLAERAEVTCQELGEFPLIHRTSRSSTQRVIDTAFRKSGIAVKPKAIVDTRDGVVEAVANRIGIGFMWEHACSRTDVIRRVRVKELEQRVPEHVFCKAVNHDALVKLFFKSRTLNDRGRRSPKVRRHEGRLEKGSDTLDSDDTDERFIGAVRSMTGDR